VSGVPGFPEPRTFDRALKLSIYERDNGQCVRCGIGCQDGDVHHRRGRGMGGRDSRECWINSPANLIWLCRTCHNYIESHPLEAGPDGYRLGLGEIPEFCPVLGFDGVRYILGDDLTKTPAAWARDPVPIG